MTSGWPSAGRAADSDRFDFFFGCRLGTFQRTVLSDVFQMMTVWMLVLVSPGLVITPAFESAP